MARRNREGMLFFSSLASRELMAVPPIERTVNWSQDPSKGFRLIDWLDTHKTERNVLFSRGRNSKDPELTKKRCAAEAALAVFACDPDPVIRRHVKEDLAHFSQVITGYIGKRLVLSTMPSRRRAKL